MISISADTPNDTPHWPVLFGPKNPTAPPRPGDKGQRSRPFASRRWPRRFIDIDAI
jgi:hypothetical protein